MDYLGLGPSARVQAATCPGASSKLDPGRSVSSGRTSDHQGESGDQDMGGGLSSPNWLGHHATFLDADGPPDSGTDFVTSPCDPAGCCRRGGTARRARAT